MIKKSSINRLSSVDQINPNYSYMVQVHCCTWGTGSMQGTINQTELSLVFDKIQIVLKLCLC